MVQSLLLFGSSYNKYKKISILCYIVMLLNLFNVQMKNVNGYFFITNLLIFIILPLFIKKIHNEYLNTIVSICSIIIWSITIDMICYYVFPRFIGNTNLFTYIGKGILFNLKYVFINSVAFIGFNGIEKLYRPLKLNKKVMISSY